MHICTHLYIYIYIYIWSLLIGSFSQVITFNSAHNLIFVCMTQSPCPGKRPTLLRFESSWEHPDRINCRCSSKRSSSRRICSWRSHFQIGGFGTVIFLFVSEPWILTFCLVLGWNEKNSEPQRLPMSFWKNGCPRSDYDRWQPQDIRLKSSEHHLHLIANIPVFTTSAPITSILPLKRLLLTTFHRPWSPPSAPFHENLVLARMPRSTSTCRPGDAQKKYMHDAIHISKTHELDRWIRTFIVFSTLECDTATWPLGRILVGLHLSSDNNR